MARLLCGGPNTVNPEQVSPDEDFTLEVTYLVINDNDSERLTASVWISLNGEVVIQTSESVSPGGRSGSTVSAQITNAFDNPNLGPGQTVDVTADIVNESYGT